MIELPFSPPYYFIHYFPTKFLMIFQWEIVGSWNLKKKTHRKEKKTAVFEKGGNRRIAKDLDEGAGSKTVLVTGNMTQFSSIFSLSLCLYVYVSIYLSIYQSIYLAISFIYLSTYLPIYLPIYLFIYVPINLSSLSAD